MVNDLDILINETLKMFKTKTKEQQIEALKKENMSEEDINFVINGKMNKKQIKKAEKKGKIGAHEILLSVDERGEILKHILKNMPVEKRIDYLVNMGVGKQMAETVSNLLDELEANNKKVD